MLLKNHNFLVATNDCESMWLHQLSFCLNLLTYQLVFSSEKFTVVWHAVNTQLCESKFGISVNVTKYGMKENPVNGWIGPVITIGDFGSYPYIADNGTFINGGLPQVTKYIFVIFYLCLCILQNV